jgi:hypothetical protein
MSIKTENHLVLGDAKDILTLLLKMEFKPKYIDSPFQNIVIVSIKEKAFVTLLEEHAKDIIPLLPTMSYEELQEVYNKYLKRKKIKRNVGNVVIQICALIGILIIALISATVIGFFILKKNDSFWTKISYIEYKIIDYFGIE